MREARFYEKRDGGEVRCTLCAQYCTISTGKRGVCGVRENRDGTLYAMNYGLVVAEHVDPVEKKPLFHFYPGAFALSVATVGCNFRCTFCQNWDISQTSKGKDRQISGQYTEPEHLTRLALQQRCRVISFTYSEPTIFYEWAYDVAKVATQSGILNTFVTNGYITAEPLREISPYLHGANVDLKAFTDLTYRKVMGAPGLKPVLDALKLMKELGIWVEVTTLVVPTRNDSDGELRDIARFIRTDLGPDTPWHVSRFHPDYRDLDLPPTPTSTLRRAYDIGKEEGLHYVYTGNIPGDEGEHTACHRCGERLIERFGFRIARDIVTKDGTCPKCGTQVAGVGMGQDPLLPTEVGTRGEPRDLRPDTT